MEIIINDIVSYIKYVSETYNLKLTICDLCDKVYPYFNLFAPHSSHCCNYCIYLKKTPAIRKECVLKQSKIREKCMTTDHFKGTCHAGLGEYIFRIMHGNNYIGFISVGEFCFDDSVSKIKMQDLAKKYDLPMSSLEMYFNSSVTQETLSVETLKRIINPLQRMIELLYVTIVEQPKKNKNTQADSLLNSIILYLTDNYMNTVTLDDIAEAMHYSKSYICHYFFSKRNMTVMYYLNMLRINQAKKLLKEEDFSISEIAFHVGFNDTNYFTNCFKKQTGLSPNQYRKNKRMEK